MTPATGKATAASADPPRAQLGVLFVHGIGLQPRGRTLDEFGGPIVEWLVAWYDGLHRQWADAGVRIDDVEAWLAAQRDADPRRVDAVRSLLDATAVGSGGRPADFAELARRLGDTMAVAVRVTDATGRQSGADDPPHARVDFVRVRVDGSITPSTWLLAESWWAEVFAPPTFGDLVRWGIGVLPRTIGSHLGVRLARAWGAWKDDPGPRLTATVLGRAAALLAGMFASLFALVALSLMVPVGLLPVPRLRAALVSVQQRLASVLGDSYVLVARPFQAAAIVDRVRRDLAWLCATCDDVAVVAHSQGGAIVNEVMRLELAAGDDGALGAARPGRLRLLATFGSGLRKLDELRRLLGPGRGLRLSALLGLLGLALSALAGAGILAIVLAPGRETHDSAIWVVPYAVVGGILLLASTADLLDRPSGELEWWIDKFRATGVDWVDYAASADPVPNGPLLDASQEFPEHVDVRNRASLLRDHTTYWTNRDEFVPDLVARLASLDAAAGDLAENAGALRTAALRRRARVGWLAACRWTALAAGLVALVRSWDEWVRLVRLVAAVLRRDDLASNDLPAANGPFGAAVAVLVAYAAAAIAWRVLDRAEIKRMLARRPQRSEGAEFAFLSASALLVVAALWAVAPPAVTWSPYAVGVVTLIVLGIAYRLSTPAAAPDPAAPVGTSTRAQRAGALLWNLWVAGVVTVAMFSAISFLLSPRGIAAFLIAVALLLATIFRRRGR